QAPPFPQRSPPRLFTVATCGGLKPTPDGRLRGACPHLLCSSAPPLLLVLSRHTLVKMPDRMRFGTAPAQFRCNDRSEMIHTASDCLVRNCNSALGEQILDVTKAKGEPEIEPDRLVNDLRREPISGVADFRHALRLPSRRRRDNAVPKLLQARNCQGSKCGARRRNTPVKLQHRPAA